MATGTKVMVDTITMALGDTVAAMEDMVDMVVMAMTTMAMDKEAGVAMTRAMAMVIMEVRD